MARELLKSPFALILVIFALVLAIVTRFYALETVPFGADGDVMWMSVDAADLVLGGVIPHYVDPVYAPDPVIVYLIGLSQILFGVSMATARIVTGATSVLTALMMLPMMWELLHDEEKSFRIGAGVLAMIAVASSLHNMNMARLGHDSPVLTLAVALAIWSTAAAWYRGGWWRWLLAGLCLALTQYIYLTGRMMALVAIGWFVYTLIVNRPAFGKKWRGWILMAFVAFVLLLPNLILFALWPSSFTSRVDPSAEAGLVGFVWNSHWATEGRLLEFFVQKIWNIIEVTGIYWDSKQMPLNTPILSPLFFFGWILGLIVSIVRFRKVGYGLLLVALPLLTLGDLITSPSLTPTPMRHSQILPVHYALAGIGLAFIWQFLQQRIQRPLQCVVGLAFCLIVFVPTIRDFHYYVSVMVPETYTNPANSGRVNQTDIEISNRIIANPQQSYLMPYSEYTRKTTAWLSLAAFPTRHSILNSDGTLNLANLPDELVVLQATQPDRARHDMAIGLEWNRWWVLLHEGQTLLLPPLSAEQLELLMAAMEQAPTENIVDSSGTVVATLHSVPLPDSFFTAPEYLPVDAVIGKTLEDPEVRLLGYSSYPQDPVAGEAMYVSLYWQPLRQLNESYEIFVQLWDDNAQVYGESHELPYEATYRTRLWQADEITVTHHVLFINEELPPQRYALAVNLVRIVQDETLLTSGNDSAENRNVLIDDFRIAPEQAAISLEPLEPVIRFGEIFQIQHLQISADGEPLAPFGSWQLAPNQRLDMAIQWDVLARPHLDYSYFLHLMPVGEERLAAQSDRAFSVDSLLGGAWREGDSWFDMAQLQLPPDIPAGSYNLWFGVYYYADGSRLEAFLGNEQQANQRLLLAEVVIE